MGFDAFGLPAEQHAIQTGTHPQVTTMRNIDRYRAQLRRLGMSYDDRRTLSTTDPEYYRWTQWIFLQLHGAWFDADRGAARPISELVSPVGVWRATGSRGAGVDGADAAEREELLADYRLVYRKQVPVNWCPGLGTVLANEEVNADGRSERGNFPVFAAQPRAMGHADHRLCRPAARRPRPGRLARSVKQQQRNWIGRSSGARMRFGVEGTRGEAIEVYTTRPETVFGSTYVVLAPEHPLVATIAAEKWDDGTRRPRGPAGRPRPGRRAPSTQRRRPRQVRGIAVRPRAGARPGSRPEHAR